MKTRTRLNRLPLVKVKVGKVWKVRKVWEEGRKGARKARTQEPRRARKVRQLRYVRLKVSRKVKERNTRRRTEMEVEKRKENGTMKRSVGIVE